MGTVFLFEYGTFLLDVSKYFRIIFIQILMKVARGCAADNALGHG